MIIGVSGYAGAGKNEVGKILETVGYRQAAYAAKIKRLAVDLDPWIVVTVPKREFGGGQLHMGYAEKHVRLSALLGLFGASLTGPEAALELVKRVYPQVREFVQDLGEQVCSTLGDAVWVDALMRGVDELAAENGSGALVWPNVVVTDCRRPAEATAIALRGGQIWRVTRPGVGPINEHSTETALDDWPFDATVDNNGEIDDLERNVLDLEAAMRARGTR